ncbi:MAG: GDSL-type esterase/lipase family protein [Acutalibacteraceae bacterium]|nr:GDSL-type esterase/lipase family protein [Acutalibacteraceae bacterium]
MKIMNLLAEKGKDRWGKKSPTIAFLGDSVTQGCFEVYEKNDGTVETVFDKNSTYHGYLNKILTHLFPETTVNIINAGISGDRAPLGAQRLQRDVLDHKPDLTVVCYGLNDNGWGRENLHLYTEALDDIFTRLKAAGGEVIFMTPNMQNTEISCHIANEKIRNIAKSTMEGEKAGNLDFYLDAAVALAKKHGIKVCDVHAKWKKLAACGVDTTELLSNKINHPTREMNWLFATSLLDTMLED